MSFSLLYFEPFTPCWCCSTYLFEYILFKCQYTKTLIVFVSGQASRASHPRHGDTPPPLTMSSLDNSCMCRVRKFRKFTVITWSIITVYALSCYIIFCHALIMSTGQVEIECCHVKLCILYILFPYLYSDHGSHRGIKDYI